MHLPKPTFEVALFACGLLTFGIIVLTSGSPVPATLDNCKIYKVDTKAVTSYVLRPPPAPEPEPRACPVLPTPKCESVKPDPVPEAEPEAKSDEEPSRHRRHHRGRRRWRW